MDLSSLAIALVKSGASGMLGVRQRQEFAGRRAGIVIQLGGALAVLAVLAIGVFAEVISPKTDRTSGL
jgi:hypothetical protein